ncbi:hypothetical protein L596_000582 [Steinernema carpocapsae]|uniref:Uncharacterized protein n=1 Tax=Steinernema carpocapsae TaxID=34508 RepID=A0A4U8UJE0_STECR|nr:hypothetical protein L596_000582 [Steinernema carpocapsae]
MSAYKGFKMKVPIVCARRRRIRADHDGHAVMYDVRETRLLVGKTKENIALLYKQRQIQVMRSHVPCGLNLGPK